MALVTVYDEAGKPLQVEPIDARELLKFGGYTQAPPEPKVIAKEPTAEEIAATAKAKEEQDAKDVAEAKAKVDAEAKAKADVEAAKAAESKKK